MGPLEKQSLMQRAYKCVAAAGETDVSCEPLGPIELLTNKQSMTSTKTRAVYKQIIDEINQNISNFIGEVNFID